MCFVIGLGGNVDLGEQGSGIICSIKVLIQKIIVIGALGLDEVLNRDSAGATKSDTTRISKSYVAVVRVN